MNNTKNIQEINATIGTVINQAEIILNIIFLWTNFSFLPCCFLWRYSLKNHTQKTQPMATWVVLTGNHNWLANITVIAADKAIQKALIWSNSVISVPTAFIILGQKRSNQKDKPVHHKSNIQKGTQTLQFIQELTKESYIAAKGQIALATSFDQWAKVNKTTANTRGILKSLATHFLSLEIFDVFFHILDLRKK